MDHNEPHHGDRGVPPADAARLHSVQPVDWELSERLAAFASTAAARDLDRLVADQELLTDLQLVGFDGRLWEYFATVLAKYGFTIMTAWIRTDKVFAECQAKGIRVTTPTRDSWALYNEAEDLANDTVANAIRRFKSDVLIPGKWDPRRGASLKTFFIGQCLFRFRDVYRQWCRVRNRVAVPMTDVDLAQHSAPLDPAGQALRNVEIADALASLDPRTRRVLQLQEEGYSYQEIAEQLGAGATVKTINGLLERHRQRTKQRRSA